MTKYFRCMDEECDYLDFVKLQNPDIKEPLLIDVGISMGSFTSAFLERFADGIAVGIDPHGGCIDASLKRFDENENVFLCQVGLSNENKEDVVFYATNPYDGCSSLYCRDIYGKRVSANLARVTIATYDDMFENLADEVFYLKIDAEGSEKAILEGAKNSIKNKRIKYIQIEYGDAYSDAGVEFREIMELLQKNYDVYNNKMEVVMKGYNPKDGIVRNFLAVKK